MHKDIWLATAAIATWEKLQNLRMDQARALERQGARIYGQDVARAVAHQVAVAGPVVGTIGAGVVGATFGLGRNIVTAGYQTIQAQRSALSPSRALPSSVPRSRGQTSPNSPGEGTPIISVERELVELRADNSRLKTQRQAVVDTGSYRDARSQRVAKGLVSRGRGSRLCRRTVAFPMKTAVFHGKDGDVHRNGEIP